MTTSSLWAAQAKLEIDDEILLVTDASAAPVLTVVRGYMGTTAATHSSGAQILRDPRYPRVNIKDALNTVVNNWVSAYLPRYVWDSTTAGTFLSQTRIYAAPSDAIKVVRVCYRVPGYTALQNVETSALMPYPTSILSSGIGWEAQEDFYPGQTIHALYEKAWPIMESDTDTVPSDYAPLADELIFTGAILYLLGWRIIPKFNMEETIFHREANQTLPSNFSMGSLARMSQAWLDDIKRVATKRSAFPRPTVIWR